jgi:Exo-beta-D-glucosaminidase Ig-fold domain/Glycosyl hydrolases family 2/Glycosyl hydrolases family 2, sugar binding domain/Glycosyl hydrolases family 2, TIM barrel domain
LPIRAPKLLFLAVLIAVFVTNSNLSALAKSKPQESRAQSAAVPEPVLLSSGWELQDSAKIQQTGSGAGAIISALTYKPKDWYLAVVPGTVLTTLVKNGVYPEPLYGENNRPDRIPESLNKTTWWYRTVVTVPSTYKGRHIWLNLDGINFAAEVWVNKTYMGTMRGAFKRGIFDISQYVKPGEKAAIAVLVKPQPHPGDPHEHTIADGMVTNGGITALDGPTFLSTIGWDWLPGIRDRDSGIWAKVFLSATGPVVVKDPLITTALPLPRNDSADIAISTTLENITDQPQKGTIKASFEGVSIEKEVELAPKSSQKVSLDPGAFPTLHVENPRLWWPNGYGPQNMYSLHLSFDQDAKTSDSQTIPFGIRTITYSVPDSDNLTISVNGVRIFIRGGDWGLDEGMKRISRERLEAEIKMHALANMNLIRNWVGQSTGEDFYELCDKYGILLWDEFFQPNPSDGPNPDDLDTYIANVRDKILRYRNHPSIAVWCARNEGFPPKEIDDQLRVLMAELEPTRRYQPSSTSGAGVNSGGPYRWRTPREYYNFSEAFKTEIGSSSIPTIESLQGMMPQKDWEQIDDAWAEHDLARGAQGGDTYPKTLADRYGKIANMADFVRKSQLANYEAYRAMYEGRNAKLFNPSTAVITWMSNPAQPSFVWQLYHHDLEPNSALFAVKKSGEPIHVQLNELTGALEVINNKPEVLRGATAHLAVYDLTGALKLEHDFPVAGPASAAIDLGQIDPIGGHCEVWDQKCMEIMSQIRFLRLTLKDATGQQLSQNFYWRGLASEPDNLQDLDSMKTVTLLATATRENMGENVRVTVHLTNPGPGIALMTHLQLRRGKPASSKDPLSNVADRVLPVYYSDNYISLVPGETRAITIEAAAADLKGEAPQVVVDGWNIGVSDIGSSLPVTLNSNAQVDHWPVTNLPIIAHTWK